MKPAILFDFNGTMVFDGRYHEEAWQEFSKMVRGTPFSKEEMQMMHGKTNVKIIEYLKPGIELSEAIELSKEKEALYRKIALNDPENYKLVDGLEAFLDLLHDQEIAMNIASASIIENIQFFVDVFKLDRWFNPAAIIYDNNTYENKIAMFKDAAERIHTDIQHCYVFEDSFSGIQCAYEAGVKGIICIGNQQAAAYPGVIQTIQDYTTLNLAAIKELFV